MIKGQSASQRQASERIRTAEQRAQDNAIYRQQRAAQRVERRVERKGK